MAVTPEIVGYKKGTGNPVLRYVETGSANTQLAATVTPGFAARVLQVTCVYSSSPTQAGVATKIDSGGGAAYDATVNTGSANATTTVYNPGGDLVIGDDDSLVVTAPAGGIGITAAVAVYLEAV